MSIRVEPQEAVTTVIIDRPERRNAVDGLPPAGSPTPSVISSATGAPAWRCFGAQAAPFARAPISRR